MPKPQRSHVDLISALLLLALATVWGGSFFFAEIALLEVPPLTVTLHRVFWAVPVLFLCGLLAWPDDPAIAKSLAVLFRDGGVKQCDSIFAHLLGPVDHRKWSGLDPQWYNSGIRGDCCQHVSAG